MPVVETYREQLSGNADFLIIEDALSLEPPRPHAEPVHKIIWTANTIQYMNVGMHMAEMPYGFGMVYGALTQRLASHLEDFDEPEALADATVNFFKYYRDPVKESVKFLQGDDDALTRMPQAWQLALLHPELKTSPAVLQFWLGMDAHIMADLGLSLDDTKPPQSYKRDFTEGVGDDITLITKELAPELVPSHPLLRRMLIPMVVGHIAIIREGAWYEYQKMQLPIPKDRESVRQRLDRKAAYQNELMLRFGGTALDLLSRTENFPKQNLWMPSTYNEAA